MRGKKNRQQITIEICINHATTDERDVIRYAIAEALAAIRPEWATFGSVRWSQATRRPADDISWYSKPQTRYVLSKMDSKKVESRRRSALRAKPQALS
jgi:hypothetical protein